MSTQNHDDGYQPLSGWGVRSNRSGRTKAEKRKHKVEKLTLRAIEKSNKRLRSNKIQRSRVEHDFVVGGNRESASVIRSLERADTIAWLDSYNGSQPRTINILPRAGLWQNLLRLRVWLSAVFLFLWRIFVDILRRQDTQQRRAIHLRTAFEQGGGTLIKFGQQLSTRLDLLPYAYCYELSNMLDAVPAMPTDVAIQLIEKQLNRPLPVLFSSFDPNPIGSASIACVYLGVLRENGQKVAVKVRRPGIEKAFAADFNIFDWLFGVAEWLTILPTGISSNIRQELRVTFSNELDLTREARFQEIFANNAIRDGEDKFTAPRVYFEYSNQFVLVQEYVEGVWLSELLAAVEQGNVAARQKVIDHQIDPVQVARNMLYANYWGFFQNLAFHADPHPANLLVRPQNQIVFIDFGASGNIDYVRQVLYRKLFDSQANKDVWGMVQAALGLLEPLPNIDVNALARELEAAFYDNLLAFESDHAPWYERTTANVWISFFQLIRRYRITPPLDLLLFARSSLLYDTLAARLAPEIDFYAEFRKYAKKLNKRTAEDMQKGMRKRIRLGLQPQDYALLQIMGDVSVRSLYRMQRIMSEPADYILKNYMVRPAAAVFLQAAKLGVQLLLLLIVPACVLLILQLLQERGELDLSALLVQMGIVIRSPAYIGLGSILLLLTVRRVVLLAELKYASDS